MWIAVVAAVVLLMIGLGFIYWLLKSMGEGGIEAAAPGSCRSGRCGGTPDHQPGGGCASTPAEDMQIVEITRKDTLSHKQTL